jgi:hypothetical protein
VQQFHPDVTVSGPNARSCAGLLHGTLCPDGFCDPSGRGTLQGYIAFPLAPHYTSHFLFVFFFVICVLFFELFTCFSHMLLSFCDFSPSQVFFTFLFSFYAKNSGFFWDYLFLGLCELNFILLLIFSVLG